MGNFTDENRLDQWFEMARTKQVKKGATEVFMRRLLEELIP